MGWNLRNAKELRALLNRSKVLARATMRYATYKTVRKYYNRGELLSTLMQFSIEQNKNIKKEFPK